MADALSALPRIVSLELLPLRRGNGAELGNRGGGLPSQVRARDYPSCSRLDVPAASKRSAVGSRNSSRSASSGWSGSCTVNDRGRLAVQGFGRTGAGFGRTGAGFGRTGAWRREELRERRENSGGRGSGEWERGRSREGNRNGIFVRLGGGNNDSASDDDSMRLKEAAGCLSNCDGKDSKAEVVRSGNVRVKEPVRSQAASAKSSSVGVLLGGVVLALGLGGLRFCRPAYAENVVAPPTLVAPVNADREAKSAETEAQESDVVVVAEEGVKEQSGGKESGAEEFEPPFGEGSDLTSDPAEVLLRSYLEMHPDDKKALQALLFLRLKKGEVNAAGPVLKKLIELEPDNLEWKYVRSQADEYAGDLDQARKGFEEILQSKPLSARAWQGLAVIMHKTGEDEAALEMLMEAVNKAVDGGQTKEALNLRMLLGQLHTMQGNLDKAMELYKNVVEEDPQDYRPYLCQGLVYSIIGDEAEAEKYFRRYRKLCPKDFPQRGFLDELLLRAKSEAGKLSKRAKTEEELKKKGRKLPKVMRQPLAAGADSSSREDQEAR